MKIWAFVFAALALAGALSAHQQAPPDPPTSFGGTPLPPGYDINDRFERLRAADMLMRGNWPNNPFATTVQGAPCALTLQDRAMVPGVAQQAFDRGMNALGEANGKKAIEQFQAAVDSYPRYTAAYNNLGVALMYMQQYDKAEQAFTHALKFNEQSPCILLNLSRADLQLRNFDAAESAADNAATLDQSGETLTVLAATKLANNKFDETIMLAGKVHAQRDHQKYAIAHFLAAKALQKEEKSADAVQEYRQFLKEAPRSAWADSARAAIRELGAKP